MVHVMQGCDILISLLRLEAIHGALLDGVGWDLSHTYGLLAQLS